MEYDSQSLIKRYTYLQESLRVKFSRTVGIILLLSMFISISFFIVWVTQFLVSKWMLSSWGHKSITHLSNLIGALILIIGPFIFSFIVSIPIKYIGVIIIYVYKVHIFRIIDLIRYLQTKIENNKIDSIEEILSKLEDIKKLSKSFRTINNKIQSSPNLQKQYWSLVNEVWIG